MNLGKELISAVDTVIFSAENSLAAPYGVWFRRKDPVNMSKKVKLNGQVRYSSCV